MTEEIAFPAQRILETKFSCVHFLSGVEDGRSGIIGPDTPPCSTRNRIKTGKLQAIPHRNEASVNSRIDSAKVRTTPKRCINQPVRGTETPLATANEVMTQVP